MLNGVYEMQTLKVQSHYGFYDSIMSNLNLTYCKDVQCDWSLTCFRNISCQNCKVTPAIHTATPLP